MKISKFNILAICTILMLYLSCKKEKVTRDLLPDGSVGFELPATSDVVSRPLDIKNTAVVSVEIKATLEGSSSSGIHYITFAPDTTKINDYRAKYGSGALLLPTASYLFYKPTVAIPAGTNVSEAAVLNLGFQTTLKKFSTYVLPVTITSIDGQNQDPKTRKVVYYVFNTGDALYVDHTGFTLTATASSTGGANSAGRAVDANTTGTYWLSATTASLPQFVTADFAREITFSGLDYFIPTVLTPTTGGYTTSAKVETSSNGTIWTDKGIYAVDVTNATRKQTINLPTLTTARYLRFTILTATPFVQSGTSYSVGFVGGIVLRN